MRKTILQLLEENPAPQPPAKEQSKQKRWRWQRKPEPEPVTPHAALQRFKADVADAASKARAANVHRKDIADALENAATQQRGAWAASTPIY
jgi:hypothetical protein